METGANHPTGVQLPVESPSPIASATVAKPHPSSNIATASVRPASSLASSNNLSTKIPGEHLIYRHTDQPPRPHPPPVIPKGKIFNLIPRLLTSTKSLNSPNAIDIAGRNRKPKFLPFEPYTAATTPLVRQNALQKKAHPNAANAIGSRNNLDLNTLVRHISICTASTTTPTPTNAAPCDPTTANETPDKLRQRCQCYERELAELRAERERLGAQLKAQVQVNAELKHLLVAAVGEDLQTRVNVLTEDKLQLARALLSTADNLSSHTEQIEYLAGQSEVWRSKFLASSLMVEELARWKASLGARQRQLADACGQLMQTVATVRDMVVEMLGHLLFVGGRQQLPQSGAVLSSLSSLPLRMEPPGQLPSGNVLDLCAECLNITQQLVLHAGRNGMPVPLDLGRLDATTGAEKLALQALASPEGPMLHQQQQHEQRTDEAFRAVVGQAFPVNGKGTPSVATSEVVAGADGSALAKSE